MTTLVLASASGIRARLLREAGVRFGVRPADVDETALKRALHDKGVVNEDVALALAEAKALNVSIGSPQALVLGCDQVLLCEGRLYDKVRDIAGAREALLSLRGKTHFLISACVLAQNGRPVWRHRETATMVMRQFTETFLDAYLKDQGTNILSSVGCYQLEGWGAQLFERVDGDFFSILGLPLIPLLAPLREFGILTP